MEVRNLGYMTTPSIRHLVRQELGKVAQFCIYAMFEWVLIALLFINGLLAFLATQFAKYCELRIPCLLCSRIDYVYAERDEDFYYNETMCEIHRRDVSYLAYCHNHKKLSDIRKMCEACLLSFATEKESDGDTYKSLVGILHKDLECFVEDDNQIHLSLGKDDVLQIERSTIHKCSCCGMHLKLKNVAKGKTPVPRPPLELDDLDEDFFEDSKTNMPDGEEIKGNKLCAATTTRSPRERVEFGSESQGSVANESDESILHRLKRQVRLDRKSLMTLYMELDEERNASAVAANNAMAMITRLQADKAAVQMEALQYQRMMEEQAEYDQEALQETQKIIRAMENELDAYRRKFGDLESLGIVKDDIVEPELEVDYLDMRSQSPLIASPNSQKLDNLESLEMEKDDIPLIITSSNSSPRSIESRSQQVVTDNLDGSGDLLQDESRNNEDVTDNIDGSGDLEEESTVLDNSLQVFEGERSEILDQIRNLQDQIHVEAADSSSQSSSDSDNSRYRQEEKEKASNKAAIARELSILNERVHNLEAHSGFLKDAAKTLQKGDGAQLLGEISENLQKLRRLMSMSQEKEDPDRRLVNPESRM